MPSTIYKVYQEPATLKDFGFHNSKVFTDCDSILADEDIEPIADYNNKWEALSDYYDLVSNVDFHGWFGKKDVTLILTEETWNEDDGEPLGLPKVLHSYTNWQGAVFEDEQKLPLSKVKYYPIIRNED